MHARRKTNETRVVTQPGPESCSLLAYSSPDVQEHRRTFQVDGRPSRQVNSHERCVTCGSRVRDCFVTLRGSQIRALGSYVVALVENLA